MFGSVWFWVIFSFFILHFGLELWLDFSTLRHLSPLLPREFEGYCPPERYAAMQAYTRDRIRSGRVEDTFDFLLLAGFWLAGGFAFLDRHLAHFFGHPILDGWLLIGTLGLAMSLLQIPFDIYDTFVLDERHGLNRTTARTFVLDRIKGLFLSVLLGGPLLAALIAFLTWAGRTAWLWAWAFFFIVSLFLQYVAPTWILPLFNRFEPLPEGELRNRIENLARKADFPLTGIFVMDGSRRSSRSNAFFTGFGRKKRIVLYDTLIERHTPEEIEAVLAHELGHFKKRHIVWGMLLGQLEAGLMFFLLSAFLHQEELFFAFGVRTPSIPLGIVLFGLAYSPLQFFLSIAGNALSRRHERQADAFARRLIGEGRALAMALRKLSMDNLSNLTPPPAVVFLHASHPPVLERIRHLENDMQTDPAPSRT